MLGGLKYEVRLELTASCYRNGYRTGERSEARIAVCTSWEGVMDTLERANAEGDVSEVRIRHIIQRG